MALDSAFFDSIHFDLEHRKYYNADRVNRVFWDIRREALELTEQNRKLQEQLRNHDDCVKEVGSVLITARSAASCILADAKEEAARILADAKEKAAQEGKDRSELEQDLRRKSSQLEFLISRVEGIYANMRHQYENMLEAANRDWQDFLCELPDELVDTLPTEVDPETVPAAPELEDPLETVPTDLSERIRNIADLML